MICLYDYTIIVFYDSINHIEGGGRFRHRLLSFCSPFWRANTKHLGAKTNCVCVNHGFCYVPSISVSLSAPNKHHQTKISKGDIL